MTLSNGWLIVQRELTGNVHVVDTPEIWATAVFSTPTRQIVGSNIAATPHDSLTHAVHQAAHEPLPGAPTTRPAAVLAAPGLVDQVRDLLDAEGIRAGVDEALPPDWAEDILAELTGHLAGPQQMADPPAPEEWALLHQQAAAYAQAQPWDRRADDVHLRLELKIGSERREVVAIVLGNSGVTRGLATCPGRAVPQAMLMGEEGVPPPEGTSHFSLIKREEAPREMLERAERYGWPRALDAPLFIEMSAGGPQELGREQALIVTVALAAAIEHDRQGAGFGMQVRGELLLASGRRGRYMAQLEPNVPLDVPPGLKLMSGEVRHDLLPEKTVIVLVGLPWAELDWVRRHADRHLAAPLERSPKGDALPILILGREVREQSASPRSSTTPASKAWRWLRQATRYSLSSSPTRACTASPTCPPARSPLRASSAGWPPLTAGTPSWSGHPPAGGTSRSTASSSPFWLSPHVR